MTSMSLLSENTSLVQTTEAAEYDNEEDEDLNLPVWVSAIGGVGMIVLIVLAVVGNLLVIISYFRDKQLQTVHNMYILNLAVTDFFLGAISMTFYADFTLRPWVWIFGRVFCKIWCVTDYVMCLNSIFLMLLLSLDRVFLLRDGAEYFTKETKKVAMIKVTISWTVSFAMYGPCVVFWDVARGYSVIEDGYCDAEFFSDAAFSTVAAVFEMAIPCIALSVLNVIVFLKIRKRLQFFDKDKNKVTPTEESKVEVSTALSETVDPFHKGTVQENKPNQTQKQSTDRRNLRAAKYLAVLVVAFLVTWAPYTFANLIMTQCEDCVNHHLFEFFTWLLWAKSSINPFLYASQSKQFKDNFIKLLQFLKFCTKSNRLS